MAETAEMAFDTGTSHVSLSIFHIIRGYSTWECSRLEMSCSPYRYCPTMEISRNTMLQRLRVLYLMSSQQFHIPSPSVSKDGAAPPLFQPHGPLTPWACDQQSTVGFRGLRHQTLVIPDLFNCFFVRSKAQALRGTKKHCFVLPTARSFVLCNWYSCKLEKCYSKHFWLWGFCLFLQNNSNRCILSNRPVKCRMHSISDSAGTSISKTNCIAPSEKPQQCSAHDP